MPTRRLPIGAEPVEDGTHFRVWAPDARSVEVLSGHGVTTSLKPESDGYFSGTAAVAVGEPGPRG